MTEAITMNSRVSAFERGKRIVIILLALAVLLCLYALMFTEEYSKENLIAVIAAFFYFIAMIVTAAQLCRCPHCGKRIISGVLVVKVCPKCKRSLTTGNKVRK